MADIELDNKTDRDLLVIAITKINGMGRKIDDVCGKVSEQESRLTELKARHDERTKQNIPCSPQDIPMKVLLKTAGAGGGVTGLLIIIAQIIYAVVKG